MLSDSIKDIRRKNYLNQTAFANRIGVTQSAVSQWENGLTRPNSEQLQAISQAFGISIDDLLVGDGQEPTGPRTQEAKIVSACIDRLSMDKRNQALNVFRAMFPDDFE